ncbi:MAG: RnfABCDGE type electron transport complex subunit D [Acidobacteriota bacterium]
MTASTQLLAPGSSSTGPRTEGKAHPAGAIRPDPRLYQIFALSSLLLYGLVRLNFQIAIGEILIILTFSLSTQYLCTKLWRLPRFDPLSAMISALSLILLLRTNSLALMALAAMITISSKFLLRWRDKHIFNPTNFGLVIMIVATPAVWVSPSQWGTATYFAFLLICLGGLVVNRAARSDVTYAFLFFYVAILFGRALWLGDPFSIPLRQLQSGAFLIFTFFMISDPRTTPDSRAGRILFAASVAIGAGFVQFVLYRTNALLWSLAIVALTTPLIDLLLPGSRYRWLSSLQPHRPVRSEGAAS